MPVFRLDAATNRSRPTTSTANAWLVGLCIANIAPVISDIGIRCHHSSASIVSNTAVSNAIEAMMTFVRHINCQRSVRSASAPPTSEIEMMAIPGIALTSPINVSEPVLSSTIYAWAIFLIWKPANVARFDRISNR